MRYLALMLCVGCATLHGNERAPAERSDTHENAYSDGHRPGSVIVKSLLGAGAISLSGSASKLGPNATGSNLTLSGDIIAPHFFTSITSSTGVVFGTSGTIGIGFDTGAGHVQLISSSSIQWYVNGANGNFQSDVARNIVTGGNYQSSVGSGSNAFQVGTNGARVDFGAGASDYASSDGTTVTFAGPITATGAFVSGAGITTGTHFLKAGNVLITNSQVTSLATDVLSNVANAAGNSAFYFGNSTALTAGVDRYIGSFYNDGETTIRSRIFTDGTYQNLATVGTAASGTGVTANYVGAQRGWAAKTTVINTAMTAAGSTDITIATTPPNTRITSLTADVTQVFTGGALTAVTVQCGNVAGGTQFLLANSVFAAQNTWGDANAEIGLNLIPGNASYAPYGTSAAGVPGAVTVSCRFICTTANCNAATQGSVTFYVDGVTY